MRDIFARAPLDRILVETDSPYLAPPPYRGRRNEPAYTAFTAKAGAAVFGLTEAEFAAATTANFDRLFTKAAAEGRVMAESALHHPWLRLVRRGAAHWAATGAIATRQTRRTAAAAVRMLVERETADGMTTVLIDTSPDMRDQLLDAGVGALDAVVYTHSHADHMHGIDDLRQITYRMRRRIPVWADGPTQEALLSRFGYAFVQPAGSPYPPILDLHTIDGPFADRRAPAARSLSHRSAPITARPRRWGSASAPWPICPTPSRSPRKAGRI